jgi:TPR repeat protein
MESLELSLIVGLFIVTVWLILHTLDYYRAQKRYVKNLHRFAREGEAEAQYALAQCYQKGHMVKKECHTAAFWYQKASFSGNKKAKGYLEHFMAQRLKQNRC